jgi:hypothetical protein
MKSVAFSVVLFAVLGSSLEAHAEPLPDPRGTASEWLPAELYGRSGRLRMRLRAPEDVERPPEYRAHQESERAMWGTGVGLLSAGIFVSYLGAGFGNAFSGTEVCHSDLVCRTGPKKDSYLAGFVPIVGPFFVAADESIDRDGRIAFASFGLVQNLGLALTIAGALMRHEVWTLRVNPAARVSLTSGGLSAELAF